MATDQDFDQKWNTAPIPEFNAQKERLRAAAPATLGASDVRHISRCFDQLAAAEAALMGARAALSELALPAGAAAPFAAPRSMAAADRLGPCTTISEPTASAASCMVPLPSKAPGPTMTPLPSKADWKTMDKAGSSAIHPVSFDQAIVGCIGAQGSETPSPSPLQLHKEQMEYLRGDDVLWRPIFRGATVSMPMLHPDSKTRFWWTIIGLFFIVYELYAIPVYLAFDVDPSGAFFWFVSSINLYFLMDIGFQFVCCYTNSKGALISEPWLVAKRYMKSWFIPDIIAGIPWEWVQGDDDSLRQMTKSVRFIRAARMFRLARLIRIMKLRSLLERFETSLESNHIFTFISGIARIVLLVFAILHWGACMWYAVGKANLHEEHLDGSPASWVASHQADYPYIGEEKWDHYVYSLYFSLTTMTTVGYGDITPTNYSEVSFAMLLLAVSSMVFAGLMGTLTDMIGALNSQRHELAEKKMLLSRYMRWRAVPRRLMLSIRQHLLFLWDANEGYDAYEDAIKEQLPPVLRSELCHHIYGRILSSAPFFGWMKDYPICIKFLCQKVQSIFLERGDHIFRMGQRNQQVYMLLTGEVVASRNENLFEDSLILPEQPHSSSNQPSTMVTHEALDAVVSFDIPRNKESNIGLTMSTVVQKARQKSTGDASPKARSPANAPSYGTNKTGYDMFDSEVLVMAHVELRRQDVRRQAAARRVQRIWREKHKRRRGRPQLDQKDQARQGLKISRMRSRHISAPAYFGESCLWQPIADWADPPLYLYTVRCESRGEIIYIPREAIQECLERFSPWLTERYEVFAGAVEKKMKARFQGSSELRDWALDFAMADATVPDSDDAALQATHTQALGRDGGHKERYNGPAVPRQHLHGDSSPVRRMGSGHAIGRGRSSNALGGSPVLPPRVL